MPAITDTTPISSMLGEREAESIPDTASLMGVSTALVWKMIRLKKLRAIKIGNRTLVTKRERHRALDAAA